MSYIKKIKRYAPLVLLSVIFFYSIMPVYSSTFDVVIEGLCLEKIGTGKIVYSIKADRATFGNKRIGFFDLALVKVINLENVDLMFYKDGNLVETKHFDRAIYELNMRRLVDEKGHLIFRE